MRMLAKIYLAVFISAIGVRSLWLDGISSGQFALRWKSLQGSSKADSSETIHYSEVPKNELFIEHGQYEDDVVVRIDYKGNRAAKEYLYSTKELKKSIWWRSSIADMMDVQMTRSDLAGFIKSFPGLEVSERISDLGQKVFETYPSKVGEKGVDGDYEYASTKEVVDAMSHNALSEIFFKDYRPLETIDQWLKILQQSFPEVLKVEEIGKTYENRSLNVVHVSFPNDDLLHHERKTVVVNAGVHAREWISVTSSLYTLYGLLKFYMENPEQLHLLSKLDFLFVPVANPDGYAYTWEKDRLWRKNRQPTVLPQCSGVDIEHSYDFHWKPSSDWACGEDYSGEAPFEALEAKLWDDYLNKTNANHSIFGYIDLHSYSQEILYPYAYACDHEPRDKENLVELAYGLSKAIRLQSSHSYDVLPACIDKDADLLPDMGAGSSLDYMYHNKAFWAYQIKLRDSGSHGFLLPSKYIEPVGEEILSAVHYFCAFLVSED